MTEAAQEESREVVERAGLAQKGELSAGSTDVGQGRQPTQVGLGASTTCSFCGVMKLWCALASVA